MKTFTTDTIALKKSNRANYIESRGHTHPRSARLSRRARAAGGFLQACRRLLALSAGVLISTAVCSRELPRSAPVPGGIALIPLQAEQLPRAEFQGRQVMVVSSAGTEYATQGAWLAVVGLGLDLQPGTHELHQGGRSIRFEVQDKQYREQRLTIKNKRQVNPNPDDLKRINREKEDILGALGRWSDTEQPVTQMAKPAQGPYSSPFGLRRFFNDQPRRPHSGLDIAAPLGSPIKSPAPGEVVATGDYFFNGRTVILDHGLGLTSMYNHMDRIDVSLGQRVQAGDQLGTIGKTGRVTGPHLHWSVSLNNERVDPALFMPKASDRPEATAE